MSNKIKCTCGHSWNKSSSSKKDMNICHVCGKDTTMQMGGFVYPVNYVPQKENGGWLDAYDDTPQAQNGIEGTMGGLTDKGFNYNGAWGGPSMQMGGNLPGSVGFMYARTQGAAPSNGPYAKKTKASAQDGTSTKKPTVKLSPDELKMERLKQYAQQQSRKEQPSVQSRGSTPDALRKQLYEDAQSAELQNQLLKGADIATDIMQVGNFVPHPAAQAIGELGNMLGGWVDSYEAYDAYNKGNYGDVAMNAASVALPMVLGAKGYRRDMWNTEPGSVADRIASLGNREGRYIHLTPPNRLKNNPVIKKGVNFNRGLLGALGAETVYDSYQNGGEMKFYQEGLDWKPRNISRDGSITKDDNGYWNPENWGKPVEIGSNNITMKGLQEMGYNNPLLGISDTGDTQMMYPGEDYKFDGESVTEYPVAQNGVKTKIPMSDFKKMGNNYQDSVNTYDYTGALWDAVRTRNSSAVDKAISDNANLVKNTSNIKPTSYESVNVGGKNYRIPEYNFPQMDPWENYEPVSGFWDNVGSKLSSISNTIGKTAIGKSMQKIDNKIDEGVKKVWRKFTEDDTETNVQNQGATSAINKQPVQVKKQPIPPKTTSTPPAVSKPKPKPVTTAKPKPKPASKPTIEPRAEQPTKPVTKTNPPPIVEKRQNIYEGSPVYSPGAGSGMGSALIGFLGQQGDTTYIKPEDYERFAVPKYGKEFIESKTKKKKNGGWLDKYN